MNRVIIPKNRTDEIKDILSFLLKGNHDTVLKILNTEKQINIKESYLYWDSLYNKFVKNISQPYFKSAIHPDIIMNIHHQIIRMNGSLQNVREENEELKEIQKNNELWSEAWFRGIRY
tara:strand:+ start:80 stop:433 length:354 start_codon:yes stop_codon:yes gene_type:complete